MKLTKAQEQALIEYAINTLLKDLTNHVPQAREPWNKGTKGHKWTPQQRARFSKTMKAKWAERKAK